mmetsp:Transcript_37219/g.81045  ORF Transcript_37219/g.81045 Transcript_37219/m.81045 type:complete len:87 (+) Transcript_37219:598-858(+)
MELEEATEELPPRSEEAMVELPPWWLTQAQLVGSLHGAGWEVLEAGVEQRLEVDLQAEGQEAAEEVRVSPTLEVEEVEQAVVQQEC